MGKPEQVYNIISTAIIQVNSLFVTFNDSFPNNTWLGEIGFSFKTGRKQAVNVFISASHQKGRLPSLLWLYENLKLIYLLSLFSIVLLNDQIVGEEGLEFDGIFVAQDTEANIVVVGSQDAEFKVVYFSDIHPHREKNIIIIR